MLSLLLAAALLQAAPTAAPQDDQTPKGAPTESYDFVAWCHGALTGHMALYEAVKPELVSIEQPGEKATDEKNDRLQMQAGRDYLALYTRALNGVDHGKPGALLARRKAAETQGAAIWDPYRDAAPRQRMWAWVGWDLPGRCETAAKALETPAGRLAALHSPAPTTGAAGATDAAPAPEAPQSIDAALGGQPATAPAPADGTGAPPADASTAPPDGGLRGPQ